MPAVVGSRTPSPAVCRGVTAPRTRPTYSRGTPRVPRIARPGANVPRLLSAAEKLAISLQVSDTIRMGDQRPRPEADRILVAQLTGEARHRARWRPLTQDEEAAALAGLRALAGGRAGAQIIGMPYVPPATSPFARPVVSPYVNLGLPGNPGINYFGLVRPQLQGYAAINQLQRPTTTHSNGLVTGTDPRS